MQTHITLFNLYFTNCMAKASIQNTLKRYLNVLSAFNLNRLSKSNNACICPNSMKLCYFFCSKIFNLFNLK